MINSTRGKIIAFLCVSASLWLQLSCGVPNLDPPECAASRTAIREFYSLHFAGDMRFSADSFKQGERFLSPALIEEVRNAPEGTDPFTTGDTDFPKTFRPGECRVISPDRTSFDVLLFWKDDTRSEQRKIKVETVKSGNAWLIDKIDR